MSNKLPPNWNLKKVDDVANIYLGLTYTPTYTESGIPFLSVKDLNETYLDFENSKFISQEEYENATENAKPKKGDIIFGRVGTLGNPLIIETDIDFCIFVSLGFFRIRNNSCEPNFLASWMKSPLFHKQVDNIVAGGAQKNLNTGWLKNFVIPLPPLPEQKAIAKVLSTADATIHATEKLIAQKELRKKWLMQQLLTGKKRLKGFDLEWKEVPLGEMFGERNETKYFDLPLLSIGQNGVYPQDESVKKDTSNEDKSKYKRICPGDIGYNTMRMWQGRSALSGLEGIVSPAYTVVTPKKNADSLFFSYLFKMPKMTNLFWRNSQGLVDDTLNCKFKDFSIVKVMLPQSKEEQTAIAQVLQTADKEIGLLKAKAEKLREQKKGLMQVLLTGKVRLEINYS